VFDVGEATLPLIGALGETNGKTRLDVAEVLSRIDQKRAQVALMDAAMNANGDERVSLLGKVADSAKRYGNLLEQRQVERALELAANAPDKEATAAAALVGSLNLSNTNLVPLILGKKS
jgi:HEAT repeat protein